MSLFPASIFMLQLFSSLCVSVCWSSCLSILVLQEQLHAWSREVLLNDHAAADQGLGTLPILHWVDYIMAKTVTQTAGLIPCFLASFGIGCIPFY